MLLDRHDLRSLPAPCGLRPIRTRDITITHQLRALRRLELHEAAKGTSVRRRISLKGKRGPDHAADHDALMVFLIGVPTSGGGVKGEVARLKGEQIALHEAMLDRGCL